MSASWAVAFLTRLYTDLGLASEVARGHARLAYSVYLGIADLPCRTRKKSDSGAVASVLWPPRRPAPPGHGSGHGDWRDRSVLPTVPRRDTYRGAKDILTAMSLAVRPQHPEARAALDQLQAALRVVSEAEQDGRYFGGLTVSLPIALEVDEFKTGRPRSLKTVSWMDHGGDWPEWNRCTVQPSD